MKYKAKQVKDGYWAVFTGKQYFVNTVTSNKATAEKSALVMSAHWHQDQIDKIHKEMLKKGFAEEMNDEYGYLA